MTMPFVLVDNLFSFLIAITCICCMCCVYYCRSRIDFMLRVRQPWSLSYARLLLSLSMYIWVWVDGELLDSPSIDHSRSCGPFFSQCCWWVFSTLVCFQPVFSLPININSIYSPPCVTIPSTTYYNYIRTNSKRDAVPACGDTQRYWVGRFSATETRRATTARLKKRFRAYSNVAE